MDATQLPELHTSSSPGVHLGGNPDILTRDLRLLQHLVDGAADRRVVVIPACRRSVSKINSQLESKCNSRAAVSEATHIIAVSMCLRSPPHNP